MPLFNPPVTVNNTSYSGGGVSLATNFYQIPLDIPTLVAEFYFDGNEFTNIEIVGQAVVTEGAYSLDLYLVKNNNLSTILARSVPDPINSVTPIDFTITLNNAETATYQLMALTPNIQDTGDARVLYAVLNRT
jgi:hypothetical protein